MVTEAEKAHAAKVKAEEEARLEAAKLTAKDAAHPVKVRSAEQIAKDDAANAKKAVEDEAARVEAERVAKQHGTDVSLEVAAIKADKVRKVAEAEAEEAAKIATATAKLQPVPPGKPVPAREQLEATAREYSRRANQQKAPIGGAFRFDPMPDLKGLNLPAGVTVLLST